MKKFLILLFTAFVAITLAACGGGSSDNGDSDNTGAGEEASEKETKTLVVGATAVPHAEILEQAQPILEEQGITLEIEEFSKYDVINKALVEGDLDANFFQHLPYFELELEEKGYEIVNAGGVHIEPIGVYAQNFETKEDIEEGATVLISSNVPDHGRILTLFEKEGLIKLDPEVDKANATVEDIIENPKNLKFDYGYAPELLPEIFKKGEGDLVVINGNYALDAGLNPLEDTIILEEGDQDNPYVNIVAVRAGDEERKEIKALMDALTSEEIKNFILENYNGSVIPAE